MRPTPPIARRARVRFAHTQHVRAEPEAIFPLLCPVREHDWIPAWECEMVYTASGVAEEGCVFQTHEAGDGATDTWVVSRHEPPERISFIRVNPLRTIRYDIRLEPHGDGSTDLVWTQEITALDEASDRHVKALRQEDFVEMVATEERLLQHYLDTGEALHPEGLADHPG